jgi:putative FmdB family regulatory protein
MTHYISPDFLIGVSVTSYDKEENKEMPIYEYQCDQCGQIEEALQKFSDKPLHKCRHCSGKLHKLISQSAFHLKGSGWYVTDYASKPQNKNNHKKSDAAEKSNKSKETKAATQSKKASAD